MGDYDLYGGTPPHVDGSDTSHDAAESIESKAQALRSKIYKIIKEQQPPGVTCWEIERHMGLRHQTASARIRELVLKGKLRDSGFRRKTDTRRDAVVWIPADSPPEMQGPVKSLKDQCAALQQENMLLVAENQRLRQEVRTLQEANACGARVYQ